MGTARPLRPTKSTCYKTAGWPLNITDWDINLRRQVKTDNPWVVGVIGSIPGGLLVNWLTGLVLGERENREYLQKVNSANREIVYAIRPGISEG